MSTISIDSSLSDQYHMGAEVVSSRHQHCWNPKACTQAPSEAFVRYFKQFPTYGNLRVAIPDEEDATDALSDALSCPGTPPPCTSKLPFSQRRLPAPALLKLVTSPALGDIRGMEDEEDVMKAQQSSCCPTARRLLVFDQDNNIDVSDWLDQQISVRAIARSTSSSTCSSPCNPPAAIQTGGASAGDSADKAAMLPPPAFELMGLL